MLDVKAFRESRGLEAKSIVEVMREKYPRYDKYLHSKVEHPELYAVRLVNEAEDLIEPAFLPTSPASHRPDRRRLPMRIQCRLSKAKYERLQLALNKVGYKTVQIGLNDIIDQWLTEKERV
jgi:hypothetical protein